MTITPILIVSFLYIHHLFLYNIYQYPLYARKNFTCKEIVRINNLFFLEKEVHSAILIRFRSEFGKHIVKTWSLK